MQALLPLHPACAHTKGNGGCAGTYRFLYRTDIRGFYRHIRREDILMRLLATHVSDAVLRSLACQAVSGDIEDGGTFFFHGARAGQGEFAESAPGQCAAV